MESDYENRLKALEDQVKIISENAPEDKLSIMVYSGDYDKLLFSFIIATGAAAMYDKVFLFFSMWAISALRKSNVIKNELNQESISTLFNVTLPKGCDDLLGYHSTINQMHINLMKESMKNKNMLSLCDLMKKAQEMGIEIAICQMCMDMMDFKQEDLIDYPNLKIAGIAKFLQEASTSKVTLFI